MHYKIVISVLVLIFAAPYQADTSKSPEKNVTDPKPVVPGSVSVSSQSVLVDHLEESERRREKNSKNFVSKVLSLLKPVVKVTNSIVKPMLDPNRNPVVDNMVSFAGTSFTPLVAPLVNEIVYYMLDPRNNPRVNELVAGVLDTRKNPGIVEVITNFLDVEKNQRVNDLISSLLCLLDPETNPNFPMGKLRGVFKALLKNGQFKEILMEEVGELLQ